MKIIRLLFKDTKEIVTLSFEESSENVDIIQQS